AAFLTVPASAFALALLGFVPLYERFSIWIVPALYVGVTLAVDRAAQALRRAWNDRQWLRISISITTILLKLPIGADIIVNGYRDLEIPHPTTKHSLYDRAAVRWLIAARRPGDMLMTTRLGWPAIWWYGRISIADRDQAEIGSGFYEMTYVPPGIDCHPQPLRRLPTAGRRLLVYLGFP